jgi:hypothetical protein
VLLGLFEDFRSEKQVELEIKALLAAAIEAASLAAAAEAVMGLFGFRLHASSDTSFCSLISSILHSAWSLSCCGIFE